MYRPENDSCVLNGLILVRFVCATQFYGHLFLHNRECPSELREAVASIIFAAPRCSDVPKMLHVRNLFAANYGKEFIAAASELRPDTSVNRTVNWL